MTTELLERLAPRLKELSRGGYARRYRRRGLEYRSSLHSTVADILKAVAGRVAEDVRVPGTGLTADFEVDGTFVFVDREFKGPELKKLAGTKRKVVSIASGATLSDRKDLGIRVVEMGRWDEGDLQTIFIDDPSFNFDYAHILPHTRKCSVMHGHTSSALVELIGSPVDGMVVDFGLAKEAVRDAIGGLDHKLFINRRYVTSQGRTSVSLKFSTVHGDFSIRAPKATTVLLEGEATVENLARELLSRISPRMPDNVTAVGVYVYEGLNKGSHLLALLHQREDGRARKKR